MSLGQKCHVVSILANTIPSGIHLAPPRLCRATSTRIDRKVGAQPCHRLAEGKLGEAGQKLEQLKRKLDELSARQK